ncbi:MAG TPA: ABC transporter ATP-binding protein [Actinomycetota bacterium]|nr:ABC transporter ATP-binding protein [Actinomycetota bacterium]
MSSVRLESVSKVFKETVAVDDISLTVEEGEFFSLLGPSGCGKTTTLRMIGGFEYPTGGAIYLGSDDVAGLPAYKRNVNTVFQSYALFPHLSVFDNVAYGPKRKKVAQGEIRSRVDGILELVDLGGYGTRRITQLSGGQQQRVALARALVNRPGVLLLDEPLGALDLKLRKQMQVELKRIQAEVGITFIYVTHDQEEAMTMSDRIGVMNAGRLEQVGAPQDVYELPATHFVAGFLGASNLLDGEIESVDGSIAKVRLAAGSTISLPARRLPDGIRELQVGVRPEKLHIHPAGVQRTQQADNGVDAIVSISTYTGVSTAYQCTTSDGSTVVVYVQNLAAASEPIAAGQSVRLTWHPEHTFAVEHDDTTGMGEVRADG